MASAREQARAEADEAWTLTGSTKNAADAASNIWEPLLRKFLNVVDEIDQGHDYYTPPWLTDAISEVKEALGEC